MSIVHARPHAFGVIALAVLAALPSACAARKPIETFDSRMYDSGTAFVYQPLNPTTIWIGDPKDLDAKAGESVADATSAAFGEALLRDLDTETVRISLTKTSGSLSATAVIGGTSVKGESYVLIADYIKYFASTLDFDFSYTVRAADPQQKGQ